MQKGFCWALVVGKMEINARKGRMSPTQNGSCFVREKDVYLRTEKIN